MLNKIMNFFFPSSSQTDSNTSNSAASNNTVSHAKEASAATRHTSPPNTQSPPVNLAQAVGELKKTDNGKEFSLAHPPSSALSALITVRDDLIQQLKASENYDRTFDRLINAMIRFGDKELPNDKAIHYTERANGVLQEIINNPTLHAYCMLVGQRGEEEHIQTLDSRFIHSQAVKTLLFLELACLLPRPLPPEPRYQDLIALGKLVKTWQYLCDYIHAHENVLKLHKGISLGPSCQLDMSILYRVQEHLALPFKIVPVDDLVAVPDEIIEQAIRIATARTEIPLALYHEIGTIPFWQAYIRRGYKQDPTVKNTPLEEAC